MSRRRAVAAALAIAVAMTGVLLAAAPAQAASDFRYWSYWYANPSDSAWTYGPLGPAGHAVDDGSVEGWRFVTAVPNPQAPQPRTTAASAFSAICGKTDRPAGKDRVAVVVDFGTAADSPPGESPPAGVRGTCAVVPDGSRGMVALTAAGYLPRLSSGLVCGLSGYPSRECGVVVKRSSPTPKPSPTKVKPTKSAAPTPSASGGKAPRASSSAGSTGGTGAPTAAASAPSLTPSASAPSPAADPATASPPAALTPPDAGPDASDPALAVGPAPPPAGGSSSGTPVGLLLGGALVLIVAGAAFLRARGRTPRDAA